MIKYIFLFPVFLFFASCASLPNGLMQDAKTLERGEFEVNFGGGLGSETPAAIVEYEQGNYDWHEDMAELGPLGLFGRIYEGLKFRAGLSPSFDITQEFWISFGYTHYEFISKTRLKYSPIPNDKIFQIALMPTFIGVIGPADVIDTSDNDIQLSFDAFGAELPLIFSVSTDGAATPYIGINPGFLRLSFDENLLQEIPEVVYPVSLNMNFGVQINKGMFAMAPEFNYGWVFYRGKNIYHTFGFAVAGGVRFKIRNRS